MSSPFLDMPVELKWRTIFVNLLHCTNRFIINGINKLLSKRLREHKFDILSSINWMINDTHWRNIYNNIMRSIRAQQLTPTNINKQISYNITNNILMQACENMNTFIVEYDKNIKVDQEHCDLALLIINFEYFDKLRESTLKNYKQNDYQCDELINLAKSASKVFDANYQTRRLYVWSMFI